MKKLLAVASLMLAVGTGVLAQGKVDQTLMDLERQWTKAALASKGDGVAPLLAAEFIALQTDGRVQTKAEYIASINKGKWQVNDVSDMKVQVHGDTAIVVGVWTGKGTDGTGKPFDGRERFADTWVKMADGKWQCVASASAPMK